MTASVIDAFGREIGSIGTGIVALASRIDDPARRRDAIAARIDDPGC